MNSAAKAALCLSDLGYLTLSLKRFFLHGIAKLLFTIIYYRWRSCGYLDRNFWSRNQHESFALSCSFPAFSYKGKKKLKQGPFLHGSVPGWSCSATFSKIFSGSQDAWLGDLQLLHFVLDTAGEVHQKEPLCISFA